MWCTLKLCRFLRCFCSMESEIIPGTLHSIKLKSTGLFCLFFVVLGFEFGAFYLLGPWAPALFCSLKWTFQEFVAPLLHPFYKCQHSEEKSQQYFNIVVEITWLAELGTSRGGGPLFANHWSKWVRVLQMIHDRGRESTHACHCLLCEFELFWFSFLEINSVAMAARHLLKAV
jgi:hypothetical protein